MPGGRITIVQRKTGYEVRLRLRDATLRAIDDSMADRPERRLIWPLWGRRDALYRHIRQLVGDAGIRRGTFRWLRRAAITAIERETPGMGMLLAGHRSRQTTERYYIDRSQFSDPPLPPL